MASLRYIYIVWIFLAVGGCSWMQSDSGRYCYCKVETDNECEVEVEFEYNNSESESEKTAEVPL